MENTLQDNKNQKNRIRKKTETHKQNKQPDRHPRKQNNEQYLGTLY